LILALNLAGKEVVGGCRVLLGIGLEGKRLLEAFACFSDFIREFGEVHLELLLDLGFAAAPFLRGQFVDEAGVNVRHDRVEDVLGVFVDFAAHDFAVVGLLGVDWLAWRSDPQEVQALAAELDVTIVDEELFGCVLLASQRLPIVCLWIESAGCLVVNENVS